MTQPNKRERESARRIERTKGTRIEADNEEKERQAESKTTSGEKITRQDEQDWLLKEKNRNTRRTR